MNPSGGQWRGRVIAAVAVTAVAGAGAGGIV